VVELEVDFQDETCYVWTWLSEARDPFMIAPELIAMVGDDDAIAMARVMDLVAHENGTIVHVEIRPGTVAELLRGCRPRRGHPRLTKGAS
jgi:hypothetical protein